ncbi:MAG TPA: hypothetical protein VLJ37_12275, partial [bacterium]|nr:hypothetical protein [bacterium]
MRNIQLFVLIAGLFALSACGGGLEFMGVKDKGRQDVGQDASVTPQDPEEDSGPRNQNDEVILPSGGAPAAGFDEFASSVPASPAPEAPAPAPAALTATVRADKDFGVRFGLVKVSWEIQGGGEPTEAY